jgi:hypothetical protein
MSILDIIDLGIAQRSAKRPDHWGQFVTHLLASADPDAVFRECVKVVLRGPEATLMEKRRLVTAIAELLGADRAALKSYLVAAGVANDRV